MYDNCQPDNRGQHTGIEVLIDGKCYASEPFNELQLLRDPKIHEFSRPRDVQPVVEGSIIQSRIPIETDEMLRTLSTKNANMESITSNLKEITIKLNSSNSSWNLLSDTGITQDLTCAVRDLRRAGSNTADLTRNAKV